jgi:hypothetical protein
MHPYDHALSSQRRHGGETADYLPLHNWFDASKSALAHFTHRALHHHREGVAEAVRLFGDTICNADNAAISVEELGYQHLAEDLGIRASAADWLCQLELPTASPALLPSTPAPSAEELARASACKFETTVDAVLPLHSWFLETESWFGDQRHLAMRHHSFGIFEAEQRFGIVLSQYHHSVPTRVIAEWHVRAVLGRIPIAADFLRRIKGRPWMAAARKPERCAA